MRAYLAAGTLALAIIAGLSGPVELHAQGVLDELDGLAQDNARLYVQPLAQGLSYGMTGGLFEGASPLGRFGFDVGVRAVGAFPPIEAETFAPVLPTSVTWENQTWEQPYQVQLQSDGSASSPTVMGEGQGAILEPAGDFRDALDSDPGSNPEDFEIQFPEGLELPLVPFAIFHGSLGIGFGTELSARFIPDVHLDDEVGSLGARGFAIRHSLGYWIPMPIDVSAIFGTQQLEVGEYLDASSTQYGVMVGRAMGPLSIYGSGMLRSASVDVAYTVENPNQNPALPADGTQIRFTEDVGNGTVFGVGARLSLLFLNLSAHYTADEFDLLTMKVGFGIP